MKFRIRTYTVLIIAIQRNRIENVKTAVILKSFLVVYRVLFNLKDTKLDNNVHTSILHVVVPTLPFYNDEICS